MVGLCLVHLSWGFVQYLPFCPHPNLYPHPICTPLSHLRPPYYYYFYYYYLFIIIFIIIIIIFVALTVRAAPFPRPRGQPQAPRRRRWPQGAGEAPQPGTTDGPRPRDGGNGP